MGTAAFFPRSTYFLPEQIGFLKRQDTFASLSAEPRQPLGYATQANPARINWTRRLLAAGLASAMLYTKAQ